MENPKITCLFFKGRSILAYFRHSNWHNFDYSLRKVAKLHILESSQKSLNRVNGHNNNGPLKSKKVAFFWRLFFQNKNCWHFEFLMNQIYGPKFISLKKKGIEVSYCSNYELSKLLLNLIEYRLDQLNNKHTRKLQ